MDTPFFPLVPKPGHKQGLKMPFDDDCVNKHRNSFIVDCNGCSKILFSYQLFRMSDLESLADTIVKTILKKKAWEPCERKVSFIMRFAVYEMCINAVEHGILDIGCDDKKRLKNRAQGRYEDYIEAMWLAMGDPVTVSLCISDELVLLGVHDNGTGFNYDQDCFSRIPEDKILEPCGKGLTILMSFDVRLCWNDIGNSILCVFRRPDLKRPEVW